MNKPIKDEVEAVNRGTQGGDVGDVLREHLRGMISGLVAQLVEEEVCAVLGAQRYERVGSEEEGRAGYRNGSRERLLTTSMGPCVVSLPRARLFAPDGTQEWSSKVVPRYQRRMRSVDDALLQAYVSGANSRRIRGVLRPLTGEANLSKSAVSRVVVKLKAAFNQWRTTRLEEHKLVYLFLDAIVVRVRCDRRVQNMSVLVALGVMEDGSKQLLGLELMARESNASWGAFVDELVHRGLRRPVLCVIDGSKALHHAVETTWPSADIQRCVVHKLRNLEAHCPKKALDDLKRDYHAITEAKDLKAAEKAYAWFIRVWSKRAEKVVESLKEGGKELLTFYSYPESQWRSLRTTNAIERMNLEFRRRIKTQASFPTEASVLYLFFGLWDSGQIRMRKFNGWEDMVKVLSKRVPRTSTKAA